MEPCPRTKRVVNFCKDALAEIRQDPPQGGTWERRWASLIALLRTASETLRSEAKQHWKARMVARNACVKGQRGGDAKNDWDPPIYGKFIWGGANLFLHRGLRTSGQSVMVHLEGVSAQALVGSEKPKRTATARTRNFVPYLH
jgi:hypothetical protein